MSRLRCRPAVTRRALTAASLGALLLGAAPGLAGCAAGRDAQTAQEYGPVDAATARAQDLRIQNAFIAPPSGSALPAGADAHLFFTVVNPTDETDRLVRVTARDAGSVRLSGPVELPAHTLVTVGAAPRSVTLTGLTRQLRPGETVDVTLTFARAGTVSLTVPVELKEGPAATIVPEAPPAPTGIARTTAPASPFGASPTGPAPGGGSASPGGEAPHR